MDMSEMKHPFPGEVYDDGPTGYVSLADFDYYCTLFEELLDELESKERMNGEAEDAAESSTWLDKWGLDLEGCLDEFDHAEIVQMRERFGLAPAPGTVDGVSECIETDFAETLIVENDTIADILELPGEADLRDIMLRRQNIQDLKAIQNIITEEEDRVLSLDETLKRVLVFYRRFVPFK